MLLSATPKRINNQTNLNICLDYTRDKLLQLSTHTQESSSLLGELHTGWAIRALGELRLARAILLIHETF